MSQSRMQVDAHKTRFAPGLHSFSPSHTRKLAKQTKTEKGGPQYVSESLKDQMIIDMQRELDSKRKLINKLRKKLRKYESGRLPPPNSNMREPDGSFYEMKGSITLRKSGWTTTEIPHPSRQFCFLRPPFFHLASSH